jgi:hypothetical protein
MFLPTGGSFSSAFFRESSSSDAWRMVRDEVKYFVDGQTKMCIGPSPITSRGAKGISA